MLIAEGIVSAKTDSFDQAFELFNRAQTLLPNRLEPYLYRSVTHVLFACRTLGDVSVCLYSGRNKKTGDGFFGTEGA